MKTKELISYLQTVLEEAGDLPVVVQPVRAHAHEMECPEVVDRARCWVKMPGGGANEYLSHIKAVVIR